MVSTVVKALVFMFLQVLMLASTAQADTSLGPDIRVRPHLIVNQMRPHGAETSITGHTGFSHKYNQDKSGKMTAAYAGTIGDSLSDIIAPTFRYTPTDNTEDYGSVNDLDQYASVDFDTSDSVAAQVQVFDAAGNLTADGVGRDYTYNSENQLIRAVGSNGGASFNMEYWYDAEGRRSHSIDHIANTETFHKHVGTMEVGDYAVTRAGGQIPTLQPAANGNASPAPAQALSYTATFRIIIGQSTDERIAYHNISGDDLYFYLTNHQGSTIAMTTP